MTAQNDANRFIYLVSIVCYSCWATAFWCKHLVDARATFLFTQHLLDRENWLILIWRSSVLVDTKVAYAENRISRRPKTQLYKDKSRSRANWYAIGINLLKFAFSFIATFDFRVCLLIDNSRHNLAGNLFIFVYNNNLERNRNVANIFVIFCIWLLPAEITSEWRSWFSEPKP